MSKIKIETVVGKPQYFCITSSPVGRLLLAGDENGLSIIQFETDTNPLKPDSSWIEDDSFFQNAIKQLNEYFHAKRESFDLKINPQGTEFQQKVWQQLQTIPYGETCSYLDLANKLGDRNYTRAVGGANNKNPLPIVIPCHRVIGKSGKLVGFASGLEIKEKLLRLESKQQELF